MRTRIEIARTMCSRTPPILENSDDDELWFEQKPPKDFDFDD